MIRACADCSMLHDPDKADTPTTDDRGGVFTGWFLPEGATPEPPHEHVFESCTLLGCSNDLDADDGMFCSRECRLENIREFGT